MNMRARACTKPQSRKDYNPRSLSEVTVMTTRRALMQGAAALAHARASDLVPGSDTTEARSHTIQLEGGGARGRRRRICTESRRRAAAAHLHGVTTTLGFASVRAAPTHQSKRPASLDSNPARRN